jgi:hypothetical protein
MTDDKIQPNSNDRPEPAKPVQSSQDAQHRQADVPGAPAQPGQRTTPGRRPLFRS